MYIDLIQLDLILSIVLKIVVIIGLAVLVLGIVALIKQLQDLIKSIEDTKQKISNLVSLKNLSDDFLKLGKSTAQFEAGKVAASLLRKIKKALNSMQFKVANY